MSSTTADDVSEGNASTSAGSNAGEKINVPIDERNFSPARIREAIRLIQCPICSQPLREPQTLPCGGTLCKKCLPTSHDRLNISFYATAGRLQGFKCPFPGCGKEHAVGDCSPDVVLSSVLDVVEGELDREIRDAADSDIVTQVVVKDERETAGVPKPGTPEPTSKLLKGGWLLAAYALAKTGELPYDAEATYANPRDDDQAALDNRTLAQVKEAARVEVDCQICYALFYDPVTTPCGHTFCRSCLQRVIDHATYCPVCRRSLTIQPVVYEEDTPSNQLLSKMITYLWADLLEERKKAVRMENLNDGSREYDIPVFACTSAFPGMPTFLHVFEPRYRLMIRRALAGDRTFGMVSFENGHISDLGTVLRIANAEFFPDGRILIETVGTYRFKIIEHGVLDGYIVAKIRKINDISIADEEELEARDLRSRQGSEGASSETSTASSIASTSPGGAVFPRNIYAIDSIPTSDLMSFCTAFVNRMRDQSAAWLTDRMFTIYGECPTDPAIFPWWLGSILPVKEVEKCLLINSTSVRGRLKICCRWILQWERTS